MEHLNETAEINKEIIQAYEKAGELALSICVDDEKQGTIKRSASTSSAHTLALSKLMEFCLLRPGHLFVENG